MKEHRTTTQEERSGYVQETGTRGKHAQEGGRRAVDQPMDDLDCNDEEQTTEASKQGSCR